MRRMILTTNPPRFEIYIRTWCGPLPKSEIKIFEKMDLIPKVRQTHSGDDHDTYCISFDNKLDVFKAGIIVLQDYVYSDDHAFCNYAKKTLDLHQELNEKSLIALETKQAYQSVLLKKYQALQAVQQELQKLAGFLNLNYSLIVFKNVNECSHCESLVKEISRIADENKKLYDAIVEEARVKSTEYNKTALQAIILSISSSYLNNNHPQLIQEAQAAFKSHHLEQAKSRITPPLPQANKVYPYVEPDLEFPLLGIVTGKDYPSVTNENVGNLSNNIVRIFNNHEQTNKALAGSKYFYQVIKNFFSGIYTKILTALKGAAKKGNSIERNSDLAENVDNIVNGVNVTDRARKLHRYNSRPSPLIAIIHDNDLSANEKTDLLEKLSLAKPYRFSHEKTENRCNLEIQGGKPTSSDAKILEKIWERSPLHHAVEFGTLDHVTTLVRQGANLEAVGDLYCGARVTALHLAVALGDFSKVKVLIDAGANVNALNKLKQSPLHAVKDEKIAAYLIQKGANINQADHEGNTPLHLAAKHNTSEVVAYLLKQETIKVDAANHLGNTPLHFAAHFGVAKADENRFSWAIKPDYKKLCVDNLAIMQALIQAKADINHSNHFGYTPLLLAVNIGRDCLGEGSATRNADLVHIKNKVTLLCNNRANPNSMTACKEISVNGMYSNHHYHPTPKATPLLALYQYEFLYGNNDEIEIFAKRKAIAEVLVKHGADPKQLNKNQDSLLHECAHAGDAFGLKYFLELGLDANCQSTPKAKTPLHAVFGLITHDNHYFSRFEKNCIDTLIQHGADPGKITMDTVLVDASTQNPQYPGCYLFSPVITAIFENDNIISQQASKKGLKMSDVTYSDDDRRKILREIWQEMGAKAISVEIPMLPELYAQHHGHYFYPSSESIHYIQKCRAEYQPREPQLESPIAGF